MNRTTRIVLSVALLGAIAFLWHACSTHMARKEALRARIKQQSDGELVNGVLSYCGQKIRMDWGQPTDPGGRVIAANGLKLFVQTIPSVDTAQVRLSISSVDPFRHSCFDQAVESQVDISLSCDPSDAPIWSDFSTRDWSFRTEQPRDGVLRLEGDPGRRMNFGLYFTALPSQAYRPGEFPFQAHCDSRDSTRDIGRCRVAYRRERLAVDYTYLTRSIRPWREVDEVVRSVVDGAAPSTVRCPKK